MPDVGKNKIHQSNNSLLVAGCEHTEYGFFLQVICVYQTKCFVAFFDVLALNKTKHVNRLEKKNKENTWNFKFISIDHCSFLPLMLYQIICFIRIYAYSYHLQLREL